MNGPGSSRLGAYLRARRELVTPEQAGIPGGPNRRVAGLRREEVALLAGISADYYLRLEQGRDRNPSRQVLEALARVLRLDDVECAYLVEAAATPPADPGPTSADRAGTRAAAPPAGRGGGARVRRGPHVRRPGVEPAGPGAVAAAAAGENRLRSLLLDPEERAFHADWEGAVAGFVAAFRRSVGDDVDDPRAVELVGELSLASARFRQLWARQDVRRLSGGTTVVRHPVVGELTLHRDKLPVDGLVLVVYYADDGSPSAERLALLGALATPASSVG